MTKDENLAFLKLISIMEAEKLEVDSLVWMEKK